MNEVKFEAKSGARSEANSEANPGPSSCPKVLLLKKIFSTFSNPPKLFFFPTKI